jgi:hypothetical protein
MIVPTQSVGTIIGGESWPRLPPSLSRNALNPLQPLP